MKRKLRVLMLICLAFAIPITYGYLNGDLRVDHFENHTLKHGETLEDVLVHYNPVLEDETPALREDLAKQLVALNPHAGSFTTGARIIVPVFVQ